MLTLAACVAMALGVKAAVPVHTWTGGGDGVTWTGEGNWDGGVPNATTEQAKFTGECGTITSAEDISLAQLVLGSSASATLNFNGAALNVKPDSAPGSATIQLGANSSLTLDNVRASFTQNGQTYRQAFNIGAGSVMTVDNGSVVDNAAPLYGGGGMILVRGGSTWNSTLGLTGSASINNTMFKVSGIGSVINVKAHSLTQGDGNSFIAENGGKFSFEDQYYAASYKAFIAAFGADSQVIVTVTKNKNAGPNTNGAQIIAADGGSVKIGPASNNSDYIAGFVVGRDNNGVLVAATNGTINIGTNASAPTGFGTGTSDPGTLLGNPTLRMVGDHPVITSSANLTIGQNTATVTQYPVIEFILGENGFSAAPLTCAKALSIVGNAKMIVDASAVTPPADGETVEYPLVSATSGLDTDQAMRDAIEIVAKPPMTTAEVVVDEGAKTITLKLTGTSEKVVVTPPAIASKVYTGGTLVADVTGTDLYEVTENDGGVDADEYDVVLTLTQPQYYTWPDSTDADLTLPFVITQAANEWTRDPSLSKPGWASDEEPAAVDRGAAKFGEVVVTYDDGESEMPTTVGDHAAHFTVAETDNWKGLSTNIAFTIRQSGYVYITWIREPSLSTNLWIEGDAPATVDPGEPSEGEVVVTYDDGEAVMPVTPGVHTAYFTVAETVDHSGLQKEIPYRVVARNAWKRAPSLSKDEWFHDADPAEVDHGEAMYGEVVVTYDDGVTEMPTGIGAHTATFTVAATDAYTGLSTNIAYAVVRKVGPGYDDVEPVTYTWTNELRNALWHDFNWASTLAADKCCGFPNSKEFASAVFSSLENYQPLNVTMADDAAIKILKIQSGAPAVSLDLGGKSLDIAETYEQLFSSEIGRVNSTYSICVAGDCRFNLVGGACQTSGGAIWAQGNDVAIVISNATVTTTASRTSGSGRLLMAIAPNTSAVSGLRYTVTGGAKVFGSDVWLRLADNPERPNELVAEGEGSKITLSSPSGAFTKNARWYARKGGSLVLGQSAHLKMGGDGGFVCAEGEGSRVEINQTDNVTYDNITATSQTWAAVDGGTFAFAPGGNAFKSAGSADVGNRFVASNGTITVSRAFGFGIHETDETCVSPTISLAGNNPVFETSCAFTFGSGAELANPPVLELMPAPGGFAAPAIRTTNKSYAITIASNVRVRVKLADLLAHKASKVTVDIARVPADGTLNVDVAQLKANTEFVGGKTWTADYAVVDVEEDGGASYKVLRCTLKSQGLLLFVR